MRSESRVGHGGLFGKQVFVGWLQEGTGEWRKWYGAVLDKPCRQYGLYGKVQGGDIRHASGEDKHAGAMDGWANPHCAHGQIPLYPLLGGRGSAEARAQSAQFLRPPLVLLYGTVIAHSSNTTASYP